MVHHAGDGDADGARQTRAAMSEGTLGNQLWPALDVQPADEVVRKYRYSAFIQGSSDLPQRLRARA